MPAAAIAAIRANFEMILIVFTPAYGTRTQCPVFRCREDRVALSEFHHGCVIHLHRSTKTFRSNFFSISGINYFVVRSRDLKPQRRVGLTGDGIISQIDCDKSGKARSGNEKVVYDRDTTVAFRSATAIQRKSPRKKAIVISAVAAFSIVTAARRRIVGHQDAIRADPRTKPSVGEASRGAGKAAAQARDAPRKASHCCGGTGESCASSSAGGRQLQ